MEENKLTDRELKKLSRAELLEMLIRETKRNEELESRIAELEAKQAERQLAIEESGTLAEACLKLNGVFEAAQAACSQYEENIRQRSEEVEAACAQRLSETERQCEALLASAGQQKEAILAETNRESERRLAEAKKASEEYWNRLYIRMEEYRRAHSELESLMGEVKTAFPQTEENN